MRVGIASKQAVRGSNFVPVYLISTGLYVDNDEPAFVVWPELRTNVALVDLVAAPGKFFLAVARTYRCQALLSSVLADRVSSDAPALHILDNGSSTSLSTIR